MFSLDYFANELVTQWRIYTNHTSIHPEPAEAENQQHAKTNWEKRTPNLPRSVPKLPRKRARRRSRTIRMNSRMRMARRQGVNIREFIQVGWIRWIRCDLSVCLGFFLFFFYLWVFFCLCEYASFHVDNIKSLFRSLTSHSISSVVSMDMDHGHTMVERVGERSIRIYNIYGRYLSTLVTNPSNTEL